MTDEERIRKLENTVRNFKLIVNGTDQIQGGFPRLRKGESLEQRVQNLEQAFGGFSVQVGLGATIDGSIENGYALNFDCALAGGGGGAPPISVCPPPNPCTADVTWDTPDLPGDPALPLSVTGKQITPSFSDSEWFTDDWVEGGYHTPPDGVDLCGNFFGIHKYDPDEGYFWNVWFNLEFYQGVTGFADGWWIFPQAGREGDSCLWWADPDSFAGVFVGSGSSIFDSDLSLSIPMYGNGACTPGFTGTIDITLHPC